MFSYLIRCVLLGLSIYGNVQLLVSKHTKEHICIDSNCHYKFYTLLFNYVAIFALCLGLLKNIKIVRILHSFFMTIALSLEFGMLLIYCFIKYNFPNALLHITNNQHFNLLIELSQYVFLFIACLMDPLCLIRAKLIISSILFMFSFSHIALICYFYKYHNLWIYDFLTTYDNIKRWYFFLVIILLPQLFYRFLLAFMPNNHNIKQIRKKNKEKKE